MSVRSLMIRSGGLALALAAAGAGFAPAATAQPKAAACTITKLPYLAGSTGGSITGTDGGTTFSGTSGGHAVLWKNGRLVDLGATGEVRDVNAKSIAVGQGTNGKAQLWTATGRVVALPTPAGIDGSVATGINNAGMIVGTGFAADGSYHGLVWSPRGTATAVDLGTGDGLLALEGVAENGTIIGNTSADWLSWTALAGTVHGLKPLTGPNGSSDGTLVHAVQGRFAAGQQQDGVRWEDGKPTALTPGFPAGVNASGQVSGVDQAGEAVLWQADGTPVTLPKLQANRAATATVVTESGQVAGWSNYDDKAGVRIVQPVLWNCG